MPGSVKKRFAVSFASNALRAALSFLAGLVVARGLGPADYGRLMFLLGSFVSIKSLLDLGTSNAFYTFISQAKRPLHYYSFYLLWLAAQFALTVALVALLLPEAVVRQMWVGEARSLILLAFAASFFQQQLWQTVNQIAEAARKTVRVQALNLALAAVYLSGVYALTAYSELSVRAVLFLLLAQYMVAVLASFKVLGPAEPAGEGGDETAAAMFEKYKNFCAPLVALSAATFLYDFADKWMLQRFGGAAQQGLYQVSYQFAAISVLATASILNIFWKEIAEALKRQDMERVRTLFRKVSHGLYMFGALLSGFLIPWSGEIVETFLGKEYSSAGPVLALMLVFPLHQSLGQIASTMLMAAEKTRLYLAISVTIMAANFPVTFFLLSPPGGTVPGLGLGAMGMAAKMVFLNIIAVNVIFWILARIYKWKFEWFYQVAGLGLALAAGTLVKSGAVHMLGTKGAGLAALAPAFLLAGALYLSVAYGLLKAMPWLVGLNRAELSYYLSKIKRPSL